MKTNQSMALPLRKSIVNLMLLFLFNSLSSAQNYRNEMAYIEDFGKNELFVKEALAEYSKAVMEANSVTRNAKTLQQLYTKLENLNAVLLKNDKGYKGDVRLRDALISMNKTTLKLFRSNTLVLNDYEKMKLLSLHEIETIFQQKEKDLKNYYAIVLNYEKSKSDFGMNYDVKIRFLDGENVFEYNAYQNLYFYMINVIDEKLVTLISQNNYTETIACMNYLVKKGDEIVMNNKTTKFDYNNFSLVKANKDLISFLSSQKESLIPHFEYFMNTFTNFKKLKNLMLSNPNYVTLEEYNKQVRHFNEVKNNFSKIFTHIQVKKNDVLNNWYALNSSFLMKTSKFENNYERYAEAD